MNHCAWAIHRKCVQALSLQLLESTMSKPNINTGNSSKPSLLAGLAGVSLALLYTCCGPAPEAIETVTASGLHVLVDPDVEWHPVYGETLDAYRAEMERAWGHVDMTGWTVHMVSAANAPKDASGVRHAAATTWMTKTITLGPPTLWSLPHELHHVQLGPDSVTHTGWCPFGQWEIANDVCNEMVYLGCPL